MRSPIDSDTDMPDREAAASRGDKVELRLWLRLLTCARLIEGEVRTRLRAEFDTTLARFDVLAQLDAAAGTLAMGALSARLMVTNGNVTGLIAGMEKDELVRRARHPRDGRSTLITLLPRGRALFDQMAPTHERWIEGLMGGMTRTQMNELLAGLAALKSSVRGKAGS